MSLTLIGTILQVSVGKEGKNYETGEVIPAVHSAFIQHNTSSNPDSDPCIEKIKVKEAAQVNACRAAIGKPVRLDVRLWNMNGKTGFWIESGVLPTVIPAPVSSLKAAV